jgi:hypothetical protein
MFNEFNEYPLISPKDIDEGGCWYVYTYTLEYHAAIILSENTSSRGKKH